MIAPPTCQLLTGDALTLLCTLPSTSVQCCITSPPYFGLRSYLPADHPDKHYELGTETTPAAFVAALVAVFREVRRVLRDDGVLWVVIGDSYASAWAVSRVNSMGAGSLADGRRAARPNRLVDGLKEKDLMLIPSRLALALQDDGWFVRQDCIWSKGSAMPESVGDRCTRSHEYLFMFAKRAKYYYDAQAIAEQVAASSVARFRSGRGTLRGPGQNAKAQGVRGDHGPALHTLGTTRNKRSVWQVNTAPYAEAHYAVFPPQLVEPMILSGTSAQACAVCGAPWRRVIARDMVSTSARPQTQRALALAREHGLTDQHLAAIRATGNTDAGKSARTQTGTGKNSDAVRALAAEAKAALGGYFREFLTSTPQTTGWAPTCAHHDGTARCTVLDPFSGTSTTGSVALAHGRSYIGIDLDPRNRELAVQRIGPLLVAAGTPEEVGA